MPPPGATFCFHATNSSVEIGLTYAERETRNAALTLSTLSLRFVFYLSLKWHFFHIPGSPDQKPHIQPFERCDLKCFQTRRVTASAFQQQAKKLELEMSKTVS